MGVGVGVGEGGDGAWGEAGVSGKRGGGGMCRGGERGGGEGVGCG